MGDAGSLWLGLFVGAFVVFGDYGGGSFSPLVSITVLAVPLLDTATVVFSRLRQGYPITRGGRDHLSHRLVRLGLSDKQAVRVLTGAAVLCGVVAVGEAFLPTSIWLILIGMVWVGLGALAARLLQVPVYQN
jgi:UDP-GlcNAc:undecaprenyl-phosphate GlcNAc-1-phosphate transferase